MNHRFAAFLVVLAAAVLLTACGSHSPPKTKTLPPSVKQACPEALNGQGAMGECLPAKPQVVPKTTPGLYTTGTARAVPATLFVAFRHGGITFPDFSNNNPCYCARELRAYGHVGEIDKANQGTGFIDRHFAPMVQEAKRHGLAVGGYDFDQQYTAAEAYTFIARLKAAGIYRGTPRTFPPTLDVEFGLASRSGLEHQLAILQRVYGRAQVYTGAWYWLPHFGCWVPRGVTFWLSGYPLASLLCGLPSSMWAAHQFSDHAPTGARQVPNADMSVFRGSAGQFAAYVQVGKAKATKRQLQEQLWHLYRERTALKRLIAIRSAVLTRHHCRGTKRPSRGCREVKRKGDLSHKHLHQIEGAIKGLHRKGV